LSQDTDIRRSTVSGLGWTASSQLLLQLTQFVFTAILARLLTPHDFGLIALVAVFIGFIGVFVDFGLTSALIQRPKVEDRHLNSAFWVNLAAGVVLMLLLIALAPALAAFFGQPQLLQLTIAMSPDFLLAALGIVQMALLQREMNFRRIAFVENLTVAGSNALGISLALAGFGVWSLIALLLASTGFKSSLLWIECSWRPRRSFDRSAAGDLWHYSSRLAGFNALSYWSRNADNLLIGKFIGATPLAFYNRAYNLMLLPVGLVAAVTSRVMYPVLSKLQEDRDRVKRVYLRAVGLIGFATFPAMIGLLVVAQPFIRTVYGPQWEPVVPILQILCIPSLLQCISRTTGWIYQSQGRTDWMLRWGVVTTSVVIASFFIGLPWGVKGVAVSYACANIILTYPSYTISGRLIGVSFSDVFKAVSGVAAAGLVMGLVVWLVERWLPDSWGSVAQLAIGVLTGVATYALACRVALPKPYREFRRLVGEYRRRRLPIEAASS